MASRKGKIYSVVCRKFVTYDDVTFFPEDYLNLIIGPNGTGKSTLVAAVIIGLGGSPKLLSRATDIGDYIKYGEDGAEIEIKLFQDDQENKITLMRAFDKNGMDVFSINGKRISHKQFNERILKDFNIQVANLCQFLPQDRIQDFAKQDSMELLKSTQKSVCSPEINALFEELIELRHNQQNVGKNIEIQRKKLNDLESKNEGLKPAIEAINERKKMMHEIQVAEMKKVWAEHDMLVQRVAEVEQDHKKARERLVASQQKLAPHRAEADKVKKIRVTMDNKLKKDHDLQLKAMQEAEKIEEKILFLDRELKNAKDSLRAKINQVKEHEKELKKSKSLLAVMAQDFEDANRKYGSETGLSEQNDAIIQQINKLKGEKEQLNIKRDEINKTLRIEVENPMKNCEQKISNLESIGKQKLNKLANDYQEVYKASQWIKENSNKFKGKIYDPMFLEINVKDQKYAKYVENTIKIRDFIAFSCENLEDADNLGKELRSQNLRVNVLHTEPANSLHFQTDLSIDELRAYGFQCFMIDVLDAPFPILNFLCSQYGIHRIPIGNDRTFEVASTVPNNVSLFFSTNHRFSVTMSRYTGARSTMSTEIRSRNLLDTSNNQARIEELRTQLNKYKRESDRLKNSVQDVENKMKNIDIDLQKVNEMRKSNEEKKTYRDNCKSKWERQKKKVEELQKLSFNVNSAREEFKKQAKEIYAKQIRVHALIARQLLAAQITVISYETVREKINIFMKQYTEIESTIRELEADVKNSERLVTTIGGHVVDAKNNLKAKLNEAKKLTNGMLPTAANFPYKDIWNRLANERDLLEQYIIEQRAKIECIRINDQDILEDYERRKIEIEKAKEEIEKIITGRTQLQTTIEKNHQKWYPEISNIVQEIGNNFSRFMSSMSLAGEVELTREGEYDYDKYGITIRVKYRNEEKLAILDRYVQSGGERAVAIAIYTLSLQRLTNVPFRCVDEINQGMDPNNERKIFEMLVNETCQEGQCQYFFITPKLLPKLPYKKGMTVHVVYNAKFFQQNCFILDKIAQ